MGWGWLQLAAFGVVGVLALPGDGLGCRGWVAALALAATLAAGLGQRGAAGHGDGLFLLLHKFGAFAC